MAGSEEQKRRTFHIERAVRIAKSQLAHKVLATIDNVEAGHFTRINVRAAVERVFAECGVEVGKE